MRIDRVEVRVVGPQVERFTWSHDLPEQYMTNTVVRIRTDEGVEGVGGVSNYTSYRHDRYTAETLRHLIPALIGRNPMEREALWRSLWSRVFPLAPGALAVVDVALWDLMGKTANLPIYQLLGGARSQIPSYASTPMLEDVSAYLDFVDQLLEQGFGAVKFHCWCVPDRDLELARAVRGKHAPDRVALMLDVENNYDWQSALRVARELEDLEFTWFEAPLMDYDLEGYRRLTRRVDIPIVPSGNWVQDLPAFQQALRRETWSRARTDVTVCSGLTPARKAMALVEAAGMKCEVMSWGNTLVSAANLHLMLGFNLCTYFEQAVPYPPYEYGMKDVIRTGSDGMVDGSRRPGSGCRGGLGSHGSRHPAQLRHALTTGKGFPCDWTLNRGRELMIDRRTFIGALGSSLAVPPLLWGEGRQGQTAGHGDHRVAVLVPCLAHGGALPGGISHRRTVAPVSPSSWCRPMWTSSRRMT